MIFLIYYNQPGQIDSISIRYHLLLQNTNLKDYYIKQNLSRINGYNQRIQ